MDAVAVITLVITVGGPVCGVIWWASQRVYGAFVKLGDHDRKLGDHDEELSEMRATQDQHDARIEKTEEGVRNIANLANTIEHLGEMFGEKLNGLGKLMGAHQERNMKDFEDLRQRIDERRSFRAND